MTTIILLQRDSLCIFSHVVEDVKLRAKSQVLSDGLSEGESSLNCIFTINGKTGWLGGQSVGLVCLAGRQYFTVETQREGETPIFIITPVSQPSHPLPTVFIPQTTNKVYFNKIIYFYASIHYEDWNDFMNVSQ